MQKHTKGALVSHKMEYNSASKILPTAYCTKTMRQKKAIQTIITNPVYKALCLGATIEVQPISKNSIHEI